MREQWERSLALLYCCCGEHTPSRSPQRPQSSSCAPRWHCTTDGPRTPLCTACAALSITGFSRLSSAPLYTRHHLTASAAAGWTADCWRQAPKKPVRCVQRSTQLLLENSSQTLSGRRARAPLSIITAQRSTATLPPRHQLLEACTNQAARIALGTRTICTISAATSWSPCDLRQRECLCLPTFRSHAPPAGSRSNPPRTLPLLQLRLRQLAEVIVTDGTITSPCCLTQPYRAPVYGAISRVHATIRCYKARYSPFI